MFRHRLGEGGRLALLVIGVSLLRLYAALRVPILATEAYYWVWGQHPALGYQDHPPMVGWISALFGGWAHGSALAARFGPLVLGALTILLVYQLARDLWPADRTAFRAALLFSFSPIFFAGGVILMPDTGLLFFGALTWLLFLRAARRGTALWLWALAGLSAGGALLSKFHAWILLPPLYGYLLFAPDRRRLLRTAGPWLALIVALLAVSPNLLWNAKHDWLTYAFQSRRSGIDEPGFKPKSLVAFLFGPLLTLSPLIYSAVVHALVRGFRDRRDPRTQYLLLAGVPIVLCFGVLSPLIPIGLHWTAAGFVPLILLAARMTERGEILSAGLRRFTLPSSAALVFLGLGALELARALPVEFRLPLVGSRISLQHVKEELVDWPDLGRGIRDLVEREGVDRYPATMTNEFHIASLMAFYTGQPHRTFVYVERRANQFALWLRERPDLLGKDVLIVVSVSREDEQDPDDREKRGRAFESVSPCTELRPLYDDGQRHSDRTLLVLRGHGFLGMSAGR